MVTFPFFSKYWKKSWRGISSAGLIGLRYNKAVLSKWIYCASVAKSVPEEIFNVLGKPSGLLKKKMWEVMMNRWFVSFYKIWDGVRPPNWKAATAQTGMPVFASVPSQTLIWGNWPGEPGGERGEAGGKRLNSGNIESAAFWAKGAAVIGDSTRICLDGVSSVRSNSDFLFSGGLGERLRRGDTFAFLISHN